MATWNNLSWDDVIGLLVMSLAVVVLFLCCLILIKIRRLRRVHTDTLRLSLFIFAVIQQVIYVVFHVQFMLPSNRFDNYALCAFLRFLVTFSSTVVVMWLVIVSVYYYILTMKPAKFFNFKSRYLTHCVTWTWASVSSVMYILVGFLIKDVQNQHNLSPCWNNISGTIHLYLVQMNELLPLGFVIAYIVLASCRIKYKKHKIQRYIKNRVYEAELRDLRYKVNMLALTALLFSIYHVVVIYRIYHHSDGGDMVTMAMQGGRAIAMSIFLCLLDKDVIKLLRGKFVTEEEGSTDVKYNEYNQEEIRLEMQ